MKIDKVTQLTEFEFTNIKGTELYANMLNRRYDINFEDSKEALAMWRELHSHCTSVWYLRKESEGSQSYAIYFSTDDDENIMSRGNEKRISC